jgi:hypothetical protein
MSDSQSDRVDGGEQSSGKPTLCGRVQWGRPPVPPCRPASVHRQHVSTDLPSHPAHAIAALWLTTPLERSMQNQPPFPENGGFSVYPRFDEFRRQNWA